MICVKCGIDKPDVMRRADIIDKSLLDPKGFPIALPPLCVACCSAYPGREWMRTS